MAICVNRFFFCRVSWYNEGTFNSFEKKLFDGKTKNRRGGRRWSFDYLVCVYLSAVCRSECCPMDEPFRECLRLTALTPSSASPAGRQ